MADTSISGKRLLICTTGDLPRKSAGASVVLFYQYIKKFNDLGFNILHLAVMEEDKDLDDRLVEYKREMRGQGCFNVVIFKVNNFKRCRITMKIILSKEIIRQIESFNADFVFCFDILAAAAVNKYVRCPRGVWLGDLKFQTSWYHALCAGREKFIKFIKLPVVWLFCQFWKYLYKSVLREFNLVVVSSKSSESILRKQGVSSIYLPYPWPCGENNVVAQKYSAPSFLFFGTLDALGSRAALHFLLNKIYAKSVSLWNPGGFQIFICGLHQLSKWAQNQLLKKTEIKYMGFVEDLNALMAKCHAVIVPIEVPVGNRSRIVTSMALETLVISHKNVSLGNPGLKNEHTCYLADTVDEFIQYMKLAYERADLAKEIIRNARRSYERTFKPEIATDMMVAEIQKIFN
jgi:glycosyltransferase involved in cell wall biosynthesis